MLITQGGPHRLAEAARELNAAQVCNPPAPWWLLAWFNGVLTAQNSGSAKDLETAAGLFEKIVDPANQPKHDDGRLKFDFTRDYIVLAELGNTLFKRSILEPPQSAGERRFLLRAIEAYERVLAIDPEHGDSHYGLNQCYDQLGHGASPAAPPSGPVTAARLKELGDAVAKKGASADERAKAASELAAAIARRRRRPDPANPRLPSGAHQPAAPHSTTGRKRRPRLPSRRRWPTCIANRMRFTSPMKLLDRRQPRNTARRTRPRTPRPRPSYCIQPIAPARRG